MDLGGVLIFCRNAKITGTSVQMAALRTCGDYLCGRVVSAIFAVLSQRRGAAHRTRPARRPHHHLALGPVLCARTEQALPSGIEAHKPLLEGGRDLRSG